MYVITGVTGKLGRVAVEDLLTRVPAAQVVAVARDPRKAAALPGGGVDVRRGDYEDPTSLRTAFSGGDVLLLVSSPNITPGARARQHGNVVDAAVAAGVGRVVYTSAIGAEDGQGFLADHTGAVYELRGPVWTLADLARTLSEVSGKEVAYRPVPVDELGEAGLVHQLI